MKAVVILIGSLFFGCGAHSNDKKNSDSGFNLANNTPISNLSVDDLDSVAINWSVESDTEPFKVRSVLLDSESNIAAH